MGDPIENPKERIKELYPNANRMKQKIARGFVVLTLAYLEENKRTKRIEGKREVKFFPTIITLKEKKRFFNEH